MSVEPTQRPDRRRFLLSGEGWPYLLVPFIPLAIVLDVARAVADRDLLHARRSA